MLSDKADDTSPARYVTAGPASPYVGRKLSHFLLGLGRFVYLFLFPYDTPTCICFAV